MPDAAAALFLLAPPYRRLAAIDDLSEPFRASGDLRGTAMVWTMREPLDGLVFEVVRCRPGGVPLLVVLPEAEAMVRTDDLLKVVELCRPQSVLPHHDHPDAGELRSALAMPPEDLASEVGDYLTWRGVVLDQDTKRIVRKIVELSEELRTVSALSRSLYLSRRALGRRFMHRGLPVPSHWLQACRLIRAAIRLQNERENVFVVAAGLGYPDGFSLSNQMKRLIGVRPTRARTRLGWEWLFEAWLRKEAREGGFSREWAPLFLKDAPEVEEEEDEEDEDEEVEPGEAERPPQTVRRRGGTRSRAGARKL